MFSRCPHHLCTDYRRCWCWWWLWHYKYCIPYPNPSLHHTPSYHKISLCCKGAAPVQTYLVGSSKNITGGLLTSSRAMERRFRWPPERFCVLVCFASTSPNVLSISSTWKQTRVRLTLHIFKVSLIINQSTSTAPYHNAYAIGQWHTKSSQN